MWQDLQTLIVEHNISHNTANQLLTILRKHGHLNLPSDIKSLVNTPRNASVNIKAIGNGHYAHFNLYLSLERSIQIYSKFIKKTK